MRTRRMALWKTRSGGLFLNRHKGKKMRTKLEGGRRRRKRKRNEDLKLRFCFSREITPLFCLLGDRPLNSVASNPNSVMINV